MNFRDELARIIARDPRYSIEAYAFVIEALQQARRRKLKRLHRLRKAVDETSPQALTPGDLAADLLAGHVSCRELCEAVRRLALSRFGRLSQLVLGHWGVHSTSDLGEIVFNLIEAGDLEKTPADSRSDFDEVFDFASELSPRSL